MPKKEYIEVDSCILTACQHLADNEGIPLDDYINSAIYKQIDADIAIMKDGKKVTLCV